MESTNGALFEVAKISHPTGLSKNFFKAVEPLNIICLGLTFFVPEIFLLSLSLSARLFKIPLEKIRNTR
jgi:hypothetical protein